MLFVQLKSTSTSALSNLGLAAMLQGTPALTRGAEFVLGADQNATAAKQRDRYIHKQPERARQLTA